MKVTPEDAKKMFCPRARVSLMPDSSYNRWRFEGKTGFATCLGAQCMMWRWDPDNCSVGFCGLAENK